MALQSAHFLSRLGSLHAHSFEGAILSTKIYNVIDGKSPRQSRNIIHKINGSISAMKLDNTESFILIGDSRASVRLIPIGRTKREINVKENTISAPPQSKSKRDRRQSAQNPHQPTRAISSVKWWSVDNGMFFCGSMDGNVSIWDSELLEPVYSTKPSPEPNYKVFSIACHPTAARHSFLAVGGSDSQVKIVDTKTGVPSSGFIGHKEPVAAVEWIPYNEYLLASGSYDGSIRIWDIRKPGSVAVRGLLDSSVDYSDRKIQTDYFASLAERNLPPSYVFKKLNRQLHTQSSLIDLSAHDSSHLDMIDLTGEDDDDDLQDMQEQMDFHGSSFLPNKYEEREKQFMNLSQTALASLGYIEYGTPSVRYSHTPATAHPSAKINGLLIPNIARPSSIAGDPDVLMLSSGTDDTIRLWGLAGSRGPTDAQRHNNARSSLMDNAFSEVDLQSDISNLISREEEIISTWNTKVSYQGVSSRSLKNVSMDYFGPTPSGEVLLFYPNTMASTRQPGNNAQGTVSVFEMYSGMYVGSLSGHAANVNAVCVAKNTGEIYTGGDDGTVIQH